MSDGGASGTRLAQLLASELLARSDGPLARLDLVDVADADSLDPDEFGALAYGVVAGEADGSDGDEGGDGGDGDDGRTDRVRLADVYVHDDRVRVEFRAGLDAVPGAARDADLRVRPKAVDPPRVLVFVEDGGEVKRALSTVAAALGAHDAARDAGDDGDDAGADDGGGEAR